MAFEPDSLRGFSTGGPLKVAGARSPRLWHYSTNDDHSTVSATNYFASKRAVLGVGDIVWCSLDLDGTPALRVYMFNAVPASGNVTVTELSVTHPET
ncbi:MAG: hypothetical protein AB1592_12825 [Pseudomonadota bacterium]